MQQLPSSHHFRAARVVGDGRWACGKRPGGRAGTRDQGAKLAGKDEAQEVLQASVYRARLDLVQVLCVYA